MEFLVNNWGLALIAVVATVGLIKFFIFKDKESATKWLLYAVLEAEKEFGSKTGQIKLRYVYDWFIKTYPFLSKFISFKEFGEMVDTSLEDMRHLINTNTAIFDYVGGCEVIK